MRKIWASAAELIPAFKKSAGLQPHKMSILHAAWDREVGSWERHWSLKGMRRGVLYVKPSSSAAVQELSLREADILRALNKYFDKPWIKRIRITHSA